MSDDKRSEGYIQAKRVEKERRERLHSLLGDLFNSEDAGVLEIGCGHGHFLTAYAEAHPQAQCTGIDVINKRIEKANNKKDKRNLANLRFIKAEGFEFLRALPEGTRFHTIFLLFPDPWPKKRHHKKRFVRDESLNLLEEYSTPDARFCFRTDHVAYFDWATEHINAHPSWYIESSAEWPFESDSYFQNLMPNYQSFTAYRTELPSSSNR